MENKRLNSIGPIIQSLRPSQWIKNLFVAAPLLFSGEFKNPDLLVQTALMFLCVCATASAIYIFNDICDREEDRRHPHKRNRPLASGLLSLQAAIVLAATLIIISFVLTYYLGVTELILLALFLALNITYSLLLKRIVILDVMAIAAGFVLRILIGAVAIDVTASHWLILCTIMISMFLGFTKRRCELVDLEGQNHSRAVLKDYNLKFLDMVIPIVTAATIICYALYTVDENTTKILGHRAMILTIPPALYGVFRYLYLIYFKNQGDDPTATLLRDPGMIITVLVWIALALMVVHFGPAWTIFT